MSSAVVELFKITACFINAVFSLLTSSLLSVQNHVVTSCLLKGSPRNIGNCNAQQRGILRQPLFCSVCVSGKLIASLKALACYSFRTDEIIFSMFFSKPT